MIALVAAATAYWTIYPARILKGEHRADVLAYAACSDQAEALLDDGHADPTVIAKAVADRCAEAYRKWLAVMTAGAKPQGVPSNYGMALIDVEMTRRTRAKDTN
jgi:hypothetical protein